jgi:hypothetical protein
MALNFPPHNIDIFGGFKTEFDNISLNTQYRYTDVVANDDTLAALSAKN